MNVSWRIHHDVLYKNKQMLKFHESKVHQKAELWIIRNLIFLCGKESWETRAPFCSETWYESKHFPRSLFFKGAIFNTIVISNKKCVRVEYCKMLIWDNIQKHLYRMKRESNRGRMSNAVYMRKYRDTPVYYVWNIN